MRMPILQHRQVVPRTESTLQHCRIGSLTPASVCHSGSRSCAETFGLTKMPYADQKDACASLSVLSQAPSMRFACPGGALPADGGAAAVRGGAAPTGSQLAFPPGAHILHLDITRSYITHAPNFCIIRCRHVLERRLVPSMLTGSSPVWAVIGCLCVVLPAVHFLSTACALCCMCRRGAALGTFAHVWCSDSHKHGAALPGLCAHVHTAPHAHTRLMASSAIFA